LFGLTESSGGSGGEDDGSAAEVRHGRIRSGVGGAGRNGRR
jgi:hypothetical protein